MVLGPCHFGSVRTFSTMYDHPNREDNLVKRDDFANKPTVVGKIVAAWIGEGDDPDVLHVQGIDEASDIGTLLRVLGDPENPDPHRPICMMGTTGTIALSGYTDQAKLIGKHCLIYADGRFESAAIEPEEGDNWKVVVWAEFL